MPSYELALIIRKMARTEAIETLKRAGNYILEKQGVLRKVENLGTKQLPYKLTLNNQRHSEGSYFLFYFDSSPRILYDLYDEFKRDIDIMKSTVTRIKEPEVKECTLAEELQPPALRKSVQELLEAKKSKKKLTRFEKHTDEI